MHEHYSPLLDAHLEGTIDDLDAQRLLDYLEHSAPAREHLRAVTLIDYDLRQLAKDVPSAVAARQFRAQVLTRASTAKPSRPVVSQARARIPQPRSWHLPLAAAAILTLCGILGLTVFARRDSIPPNPAIANVEAIQGWVTVEHETGTQNLELNSALVGGDRIATASDGRTTIRLTDGSRFELEPSSWLRISTSDGARASLERGTVVASVTHQGVDAPPILSTPNALIRVLGTEFRVTVTPETTLVQVTGGIVAVRSHGGSEWRVKAGETLHLQGDRGQQTSTLSVRSRATDGWRNIPIKTLSTNILPSALRPPTDARGARTDRTRSATNGFRVEQNGSRWQAVSPEGHPLLLLAVSQVNHAAGLNAPAVREHFSSAQTWADFARTVVLDHGFNLFGSNSAHATLATGGKPTPAVVTSEVARLYAEDFVARHPGLRQQPKVMSTIRFLAPLLPAFRTHVRIWSEQLATGNAQQAVILTTDEYHWMGRTWKELRELARAAPELERTLSTWLAARGRTWENATNDDTHALRLSCLSAYRDIVYPAARAGLPHAIFMGCTVTPVDLADPVVVRSLATSVDAVAVNLIGTWLEDGELLREIARTCKRPLWVSSFYAKGADSGLPNRDGNGFEVATQVDRARFYQHHAQVMLESQVVIGWQWFRFENVGDQPLAPGKLFNANKGLVDTGFRPYPDLLDGMNRFNRQCYQLMDQIDRGSENQP